MPTVFSQGVSFSLILLSVKQLIDFFFLIEINSIWSYLCSWRRFFFCHLLLPNSRLSCCRCSPCLSRPFNPDPWAARDSLGHTLPCSEGMHNLPSLQKGWLDPEHASAKRSQKATFFILVLYPTAKERNISWLAITMNKLPIQIVLLSLVAFPLDFK